MKKTGVLLLILAAASWAAAQEAAGQQQPQGTPPPSMQQGVQEPLPAPPPQVKVKETNLVEKVQAPTDADVYCSGFISSQPVPEGSFVRAGWDTPAQTRFNEPNYVYVQGSGFQEGARYLVIRKLRDPNRWEAYTGQHGDINKAGQRYADIGELEEIGRAHV